jgi:histidinol dehydrogenase
LLAQAEHDDDAVPMLVTTDAELVPRVDRELRSQLETLPTAATARTALRNGFALIAKTLDQALLVANRIGPEHMEIMTIDASAVARGVTNAGALFLGAKTSEALGDYGAGPNHVLPTGGTSRFRAGLSVFSFVRARSWLRIDDSSTALAVHADAVALARIENLEAHARSVERRAADRPVVP